MKGLFRTRRQEHRVDETIRQQTADVLVHHRESLKKVRQTLASADETIIDEIRRLDAALGDAQHA